MSRWNLGAFHKASSAALEAGLAGPVLACADSMSEWYESVHIRYTVYVLHEESPLSVTEGLGGREADGSCVSDLSVLLWPKAAVADV